MSRPLGELLKWTEPDPDGRESTAWLPRSPT